MSLLIFLYSLRRSLGELSITHCHLLDFFPYLQNYPLKTEILESMEIKDGKKLLCISGYSPILLHKTVYTLGNLNFLLHERLLKLFVFLENHRLKTEVCCCLKKTNCEKFFSTSDYAQTFLSEKFVHRENKNFDRVLKRRAFLENCPPKSETFDSNKKRFCKTSLCNRVPPYFYTKKLHSKK